MRDRINSQSFVLEYAEYAYLTILTKLLDLLGLYLSEELLHFYLFRYK